MLRLGRGIVEYPPVGLEFHVEAAVAALAVADVDPAAAFLVDALVNGQVEALDEFQQAAVAAA